MVENIVFILVFFIAFYCFLLFYDFCSLYYRKKEEKISEKHRDILVELFKSSEKGNRKANYKIIKKLKKLSYLSAFSSLLEEKNSYINEIVKDDKYVNIFVLLAHYYEKKSNLEASYYAYVLHFLSIDKEEIYNYLFHCLSLDSIYCIENALWALYSLGDEQRILEAYLFMTEKNVDYGYKLVADGLRNFKGNKKDLCSKLYEHFDQFNDSFKIGFLTFFRQSDYEIKDELFYRIEENKLEKEVIIEAIRYFSKINYKKIAPLLITRLDDNYYNDFEYDVVIIQTLANYPSKKTKDVLIKSLSDDNYYVRYNAAKSLKKMTDLKLIKDLDDSFAKEMIASFIEGV